MGSCRSAVRVGVLFITGFCTACATSPTIEPGASSREIAQAATALTPEQIEILEETGIEVLSLSMLTNRIGREEKIAADLRKKLEEIGVNGEARPGNVSSVGVTTALGLVSAGIGYGAGRASLSNSPEAVIKAFNRNTSIVVIGSVAIGAAMSISQSSKSSASLNKITRQRPARSAEGRADAKTEAAFREFEEQVAGITKTYSQIFQLTGDPVVILEQEIRTAALTEGAKSAGANDVKLDVPRLMSDAGLIGKDQYQDFLEVLARLRKSTDSAKDVDAALDGKQFKKNLGLAKNTIEAYVGWLRAAKSGLDEGDTRVVTAELRRAERVLLKLKDRLAKGV